MIRRPPSAKPPAHILPSTTLCRADWSGPDARSALPAAPARVRAAGKVNNFIRALIGRIPPVPGVLAYDRDIPIDLVGIAEKRAAAQAAAEAVEAAAARSEEHTSELQSLVRI